MKKVFLLIAFTMMSIGCGPSDSSELKKFKDVRKAVVRDDGLYNVICLDGTIETAIPLEQIERDDVCNSSPADNPRSNFIRLCKDNSPQDYAETFKALKQVARKKDCSETYDEIRRRETLIIFAFPPANSDAITQIEPIKYFTNLKRLGIFAQRVSDISPLAGLIKLEDLALTHNLISDVTPLQGLTNLKYLDLSNNLIKDFTPVVNLPRLQSLKSNGNPGI